MVPHQRSAARPKTKATAPTPATTEASDHDAGTSGTKYDEGEPNTMDTSTAVADASVSRRAEAVEKAVIISGRSDMKVNLRYRKKKIFGS